MHFIKRRRGYLVHDSGGWRVHAAWNQYPTKGSLAVSQHGGETERKPVLTLCIIIQGDLLDRVTGSEDEKSVMAICVQGNQRSGSSQSKRNQRRSLYLRLMGWEVPDFLVCAQY